MTTNGTSATTGVLFYNVWGPRHPKALKLYLGKHLEQLDVLCLTEVTHYEGNEPAPLVVHTSDNRNEPPCYVNGTELILTDDYRARFRELYGGNRSDWYCAKTRRCFRDVTFGSLMLLRREIKEVASGNHVISFTQIDDKERVLQWVVYDKGGTRFLVAHLHGVWIRENTKGDHPARTEQSLMVRETLCGLVNQYQVERTIFGGDLNLGQETMALRVLLDGEGSPVTYRNLIAEYGIVSTRTPEYRHYNWRNHSQYADYVMVCPETTVHAFSVNTGILVSDHAPLMVTVS